MCIQDYEVSLSWLTWPLTLLFISYFNAKSLAGNLFKSLKPVDPFVKRLLEKEKELKQVEEQRNLLIKQKLQ